MTANQIKGKGFGGALDYNLEKVEQRNAEILEKNFFGEDRKAILKEVAIIKAERPNLQKYFYHTSINFPPNENLSNDMMKEIGKEYLELNGFNQHQYIMFRHYDANHPHLHILVNRIGYDGSVVSDSNDFARSEKVLRQLELKYNLTQVAPSKQSRQRAVTKDELEMMKRTNTPSGKLMLQVIIKEVLNSKPKPTTEEFIKALHTMGVNVKFNQATTGYVSGISYSYKGFVTTGAKLGTRYKWTSIKGCLNYDQERDWKVIQQGNAHTQKGLAFIYPHERTKSFDLPAFSAGIGPIIDCFSNKHTREPDQTDPVNRLLKQKKKKKRRRKNI